MTELIAKSVKIKCSDSYPEVDIEVDIDSAIPEPKARSTPNGSSVLFNPEIPVPSSKSEFDFHKDCRDRNHESHLKLPIKLNE